MTAIGRFAESLEASKKAIELEPFDLPAQNHLGWSYYFAGDYELPPARSCYHAKAGEAGKSNPGSVNLVFARFQQDPRIHCG